MMRTLRPAACAQGPPVPMDPHASHTHVLAQGYGSERRGLGTRTHTFKFAGTHAHGGGRAPESPEHLGKLAGPRIVGVLQMHDLEAGVTPAPGQLRHLSEQPRKRLWRRRVEA